MNNRASSFSCGIICEYESESFPYFDSGFEGMYQAPYLTAARTSGGSQGIWDSYGNYASYPITDPSMFGNPHFDTTTVLNAFLQGNNTTVQSDTGNYGTANFHYDWYSYRGQQSEDGSYCEYPISAYEDLGGPGQVPACATPTDEIPSYRQQTLADPAVAPTAGDFIQTLITVGNDDGNQIREQNNGNGSDTCWFNLSAYSPMTSVSGGLWTVGGISPGSVESQVVTPGHNQWGPDLVGYAPGPVRYYQQQRAQLGLPMPCGFTVHQNLSIRCTLDQLETTYKANIPVTSTIDTTGLTNCREGVCAPHYHYQ